MEKIISILLTLILAGGCGYSSQQAVTQAEYQRISATEAYEMMGNYDVIILDVRTQEEFDSGHIPNAVLLPLDEITADDGSILYRFGANQVILVYCQSGRRSEIAARALIYMGFTNVFDFGGINAWIGEIVR